MDERYQLGKIYTIRCHSDNTMIYVGSTIQPLSKRIGTHRSDSKMEKCKNNLLYQAVNGDWDNWYIELYELCPCNSKEELCRREGEVIREIGTLNKIIAGRSKKEWREDNRDKLLKQKKEWYEDNRDKLAEQKKVYYEDNKSKIIERAKEYYENNREKISEQKNIYRENNKAKIAERNAEIVVCQYCGCKSTKRHLPRHQKSAKCISSREST